MYLKRLEIQGFKSFPEKIRLEFNKGITVVVGPNGSGKSNISDAVRWVLGEQSPKSLRGSKMEDIIFAGTASRRPLGFAEVSLVMDNSSKLFSLDYSEITVTRKVYRSGESEYLINGTVCRLKDVHELFMDTGIGREGYSIIGQGRIDEILSSKSEDRRLLFEEAAGIGKYKSRRHETNLKLEKEKQNLIRVNDIIDELEKQIEPLELQSEKAKQYLKLMEKLKLLHINMFLNEVEEFQKEMASIQEKISIINNQITDETEALNQYKKNHSLAKDNIKEIEKSIEESNNKLNSSKIELQNKQNNIVLIEQQINNLTSTQQRILSEVEQKNSSIKNNISDKDIHITKRNSLMMELISLRDKLAKSQMDFEQLSSKLSDNEQLIEKYNTEILENMKDSSEIENNLNQYNFIREQSQKRQLDITNEMDYIESQLHDKNVRLKVLQSRYDELIKKSDEYVELLKNYDIESLHIKEEISLLDKKEIELSKNITDKSSKYKILSELEEGYEGYFRSVKMILQKRKSDPKSFEGIHGAVGNLINVPKEYETAIETALGSSVQNIVTDDEASAKKAIEYLKRNKAGRATFLPLSAIKPKSMGNIKETLLAEKGVIGLGKDLISYESEYENIISSLLGRVVVMDTLDNAIDFSKKHDYSYRVVTLDGESLNIGGSLTGGSISKNISNIFSRGREIRVLKDELTNLKDEHTNIVQQLSNLQEDEKNVILKIESVNIDIQEIKLELGNLNNDIVQQKNIINEFVNKKSLLDTEQEEITAQVKEIDLNIDNFNQKKSVLIEQAKIIRNSLEKHQTLIQEDKEIKESTIKYLTDLRISITEIEQNIKSADENISRIENDITALKSDIEKFQSELEKNEIEVEANKTKISVVNEEILELNKIIDEIQNKLSNLNLDKEKIQEEILEIENKSAEKTELLSNLKNNLVRIETKKEQTEENNRRRYDYIWEEYEITYQSAKGYSRLGISKEAMQREERNIKNEVKQLGTINVSAIEECKQVKERYDFLTTQRDDIINAENRLREIIQELTKLMEEQFINQFRVISENFNVVFTEMFGGGRANLILSEENNILESGIDIIVEPPGKTLKNMMLLSGGERALTAIALLFAILKMKPSPFCILDEIEAALDDSNVNRYANYLKNFSDNTQFIIITHRKGTMEAADIIYGVTMQEQGVSKLVSVNFSENMAN